uniref:Mucin-2 n=1 Tax=Urocitellus parryii TaxID=9999 RepID=A0A8D2ICB1_UROPR
TMLGLWLLLLLPHGGALLSTGEWGQADPPEALEKGWCSSWGAGHFSTFDHHAYDFLGTCNYIFAASCQGASPTFSIQLRRGADGNISRIIVELGSSVVTVNETTISIKDIGVVSLPYTSQGLQITPYGQSVQLVAKQVELELVVMWGPDAHLMVRTGGLGRGTRAQGTGLRRSCPPWAGVSTSPTLQVLVERKYMGQMCGLCGNFDGKTDNEFLSEDGTLLEPYKYAALQKLDDPNEICTFEAIPRPPVLQWSAAQVGNCTQLLTLVSPECDVPKKPLVLSCQVDMATCAQPGQQNCSCATLSEYSRRCSMAHRPVSNWRGPGLCCESRCPANQVYQECGTACIRTCSNPQHSCSSPCTFGCFCPKGMVLNDLSNNHTCVPVSQCPCLLNGVVYSPGEVVRAACQSCQCTMGHWTCTGQPCPGHCSLEGGSFVTTFDARPYRFHGTCTYILLQSPQLPNEGTLMAVYDKSGYSHSETSLVAIVYLSGQDKIVISEDEVTNNGDAKWLPYQTRNITIFRQTSTHLQMATTFGLEIVVQRQPVFQVYITLGPQFRGQTRGLCGNFNGNTTDEFTSSAGIDEGTAALFVDSWRAGNCPAALEREIDPCSMSQLNKMYAETHCSVLLKKDGVFEKCHAVLDPKPFYKRCVYQACNYEETFPHICAALGAYVRACSSQAVLLGDWRDSVDNCTIPCTGNRTFSQQSQACDHTCLSLSNREVECHPSAVPVDGCNCPDGTYLDHRNECVRKAQCPCLLESHKFILAGQSTMVNGIICHCINGRLSCPGQSQVFLASCPAPKSFQSCSQSSEDKFGAACAPTCQMLATGITCVPTKCEPGCVCPEGFYEDTSGQCVLPGQCPCDFAGVSYPGGAVLRTDCKNCTCSQGKWTCQQSAHCPSTCILYGEGHIITFDGQRFVFNGNCKYTLATDDCGANSQPSFKILVENVVCGKSGATCSRAIQILLGGLTITMADRNYSISGENSQVHVLVKPSSLNLVLDVDIPNRLNMTLVWNKHMSVSIRVHRASQDALCGLCGNCNGNMKDDFETRSKYVASNELEFVNSWKESPLCSDASYAEDPCSLNPFRRPWAERKCSIIHSQTFTACHSKVYRMPYYEACVRDACLCDKGGDCECLCDAVAAYAKACLDKGVCVDWRAPDFCPIYCDFYNTHSQVGDGKFQYTQEANCTWHYQPCLCPGRLDSFPDTNVEGCYNCSQDEYFDHRTGTCVPCSKSSCRQAACLPATDVGCPVSHTSSATHTRTRTPRTSQSSYTTSASTTAHPSVPLKLTSLKTPSAFSDPSGKRTSLNYPVFTSSIFSLKAPSQSLSRTTSQELPWGTSTPKPKNSSLSTTAIKATGHPSTAPLKTLYSKASTHAPSSDSTSRIPRTPLPHPWPTPFQESTSPLATTKTKTESPVVLTSLGTQSSPPIPGNLDSSHTMDTFATARPSVTLTGTSLKTTKRSPASAGPQTTHTSVFPNFSTLSNTMVRATGPTYTAALITMSTSASSSAFLTSRRTPASLPQPSSSPHPTSTSPLPRNIIPQTSPAPLSFLSFSRYVKSTSPFATTITKTRKPMPLNSWDLHTTQQIPLTPEPSYSDSASTMANALNGLTRTLPYNTSLLTLPTDAQTSPTALLSTLYSLPLTPTSQSLTSPLSPQARRGTSSPRPTGASLSDTTLKAPGPTNAAPLMTTSTNAARLTHISGSTCRTFRATLSYPWSTPYLKATSAVATALTQKGSLVTNTSLASRNTPQIQWTAQSSYNASASTDTHPHVARTRTTHPTTSRFPMPAIPDTSLMTLISTLSAPTLTLNSQSPRSPPKIEGLWGTSTPRHMGFNLTTTIGKGTGSSKNPSPNTTTTQTSIQAKRTLSTLPTSPHLLSFPLNTPYETTTLPIATNMRHIQSPAAHILMSPPSTPHRPWTSQDSHTSSASTTAHLSLHLTPISLKTTSPFPPPTTPHSSLTSLTSTLSSASLTPNSQNLNSPFTSQVLCSTSSLRSLSSSPSNMTIQDTGPTNITPQVTTSTRTRTRPNILHTNSRHYTAPRSFPSTTAYSKTKLELSTIEKKTMNPMALINVALLSTPQIPSTSHSLYTTSASTTARPSIHLTGTTFPTPTAPQTSPTSLLSTLSTSPLTSPSHRPTSPELLWSTSFPRSTGSSLSTTAFQSTGPTSSAVQMTTSSRASTQALSSVVTVRTSASSLSHLSSSPYMESTSPLSTNIITTPTNRQTRSPMAHTSSATHTSTHTLRTSQSPYTASASTTLQQSVPLSGTSLPTTSAYPTSTGHKSSVTSLGTTLSTISLTPTSQSLTSPTSPELLWSTSIPRPIDTSLSTTAAKPTGPRSTSPLMTSSTWASTQAHWSFHTASTSFHLRSSSSPLSSISTSSSTLSPAASPSALRSLFTTSVSVETIHPSTLLPKASSTSSLPTSSLTSSSPFSALPSSRSPLTTSSTSVPSTSPTAPPLYAPTSSSIPPAPFSTASTSGSHFPSPSVSLPTPTSSPVNTSLLPLLTSSSPDSALPTLPAVHTSATPAQVLNSSPGFPSTSRITPSASPSSAFSQSTTSQLTSLTTQASMPSLVSSTLGMTSSTVSPTTNLTSSPPGTSRLLTSMLLSSYVTSHGSSSTFPPATPSWVAPSASSHGACSVQEHEQEITYQGCTANVTLTRCEGACASSVSFNITTQQVDAQCSCCYPLNSYKKQLLLPCPDPNAPGQQLKLTLQVFSSCVCKLSHCKD